MMPTRSNSQFMVPSVLAWISELIGSFWPIFHPKRCDEPASGERAGPRPSEGLALRRVDGEFRIHVEVARGIHGEHREGVALVLVLGPEPVGVRHADHARDLLDPAQIAHRQRLDDRVARGGEQALGVGHVGARVEGHLHRLEEAEQRERHRRSTAA